MSNTNTEHTSDAQKELMRVMDVTWDDIHTNEQGKISNHQFNTRGTRVAQTGCFLLFLGLIFAGTAIGVFILTNMLSTTEEDMVVGTVLLIVFGLIGLFCILGFYLNIRAIGLDWRGNRVERVEGLAVVTITDDSATLKINDTTFLASSNVLERIKHMDQYIVYYLPRTRNVISMQHLPDKS